MGVFDLGTGLLDGFIRYRGYSADPYSSLEDFSDRLSHFFTTIIIMILAGVTMTNVYFLRPISCTLPTAPDGGFTSFAEALCWVQGTIGLNLDDPLPDTVADWLALREKSDISFYQWVPFCLSIQAMLFYLPHLIWQALGVNSLGDNLECLITRAKKANQVDDRKVRTNLVNTCADHLYQISRQHSDVRSSAWAHLQRRLSRAPGGRLFVVGKRMGNRLSFIYLLIKLLYIANAVGQLFLIMQFLGHANTNFVTFGGDLFNIFKSRREWGGSEFFPKQTLCPVRVPHLGKRTQVYTAICALPVNMFNEKIYIFLWVWICFIFVVSIVSLFVWLMRLLMQSYSQNFMREFLAISILSPVKDWDIDSEKDEQKVDRLPEEQVNRFLKDVVRCDGNFMIRMLRVNAGDVVAGEILSRWWKMFKMADEKKQASSIYDKLPAYLHGANKSFDLVLPNAPILSPDCGGDDLKKRPVKRQSEYV